AERRERAGASGRDDGESAKSNDDGTPGPLRPIRDVVEVIPTPMWILIGVLALIAAAMYVRSMFAARRARHLEAQRAELLGDVGLLQKALLPDVPARIGTLEASVAYRPAEGPAAGGDFYDVFEMEGDRVGIIVGDVCGHGRQALAVTALMRYTLRAYLNAGGEPRAALQIAARALENEPHAELTTVVLAVYDSGEGTLTYACAGHEPPILVGPSAHAPVTVGSSPPIGAGLVTGVRQTTVALPPGSIACFFTDGLVEARLHGDDLLGRDRLCAIVEELGANARADALLAKIAGTAERAPDDMAACIIRAAEDAKKPPPVRLEELELDDNGIGEERARGFLAACGVPGREAETVLKTADGARAEFGGAMLRVRLAGESGGVKVVPLEMRSLAISPNGSEPHAAMPAAPPISA
ncbi:MAG: serine/threonine-protein phosphatase, partial [Actinomycetota bacterium]|nr:serine/threonine-protein phosphatase [Actinomycetota bacterium]